MPLITVQHYTREEVRSHPDHLYVFGDNDARAGFGGQAGACRGEPNAVGIPTKRRPAMSAGSFYADADLDRVRPVIQAAFRRLSAHLAAGGTVVWPADGVGTGRAALAEHAPAIRAFIDRCYDHLVRQANG